MGGVPGRTRLRGVRHHTREWVAWLDGKIQLPTLPSSVRDVSEEGPAASSIERPLTPADEELRATLVAAIKEHEGNLSAVARQMGRDPKQVRRWVKRFKLSRDTGDA